MNTVSALLLRPVANRSAQADNRRLVLLLLRFGDCVVDRFEIANARDKRPFLSHESDHTCRHRRHGELASRTRDSVARHFQ